MAFGLASSQVAIRLKDVVNSLLQARTGLLKGLLLHVAAWKLLGKPDPPPTDLLEYACLENEKDVPRLVGK